VALNALKSNNVASLGFSELKTPLEYITGMAGSHEPGTSRAAQHHLWSSTVHAHRLASPL